MVILDWVSSQKCWPVIFICYQKLILFHSSGKAENKNVFLYDKVYHNKATKLYYTELRGNRCKCTLTFIFSLSKKLSFSAQAQLSNRKYFY